MEINAISLKPAFKGEEKKAETKKAIKDSDSSDKFEKKANIPDATKVAGAAVAGAVAIKPAKAATEKVVNTVEQSLKEMGADIREAVGEGTKEAKTKLGQKLANSKIGKKVKTFVTEKFPKFADKGFSTAFKKAAKWIGGIGAAVAAAVAVLRDKDKDGKPDIFEALHILLHPEELDINKEEA